MYASGMAAGFALDVLAARLFAPTMIARWALFKSLMLIGSAVATWGVDQALIRWPGFWAMKRFIIDIQLIIGAVALSVIFSLLFRLSGTDGALMAVSVWGLSFVAVRFALLRGASHFTSAQYVSNSWRVGMIAVVAILSLTTSNLDLNAIAACVIVLSIPPVIGLVQRDSVQTFYQSRTDHTGKRFHLKSTKFVLLSGTLVFSIYADQLLLSRTPSAAAEYFAHMSVYSPILLAINGFVGFYVAPRLRDGGVEGIREFRRFVGRHAMAGALAAIVSFSIGSFVFDLLFDGRFAPRYDVALLITVLSLLRFLYSSTSIYFAALASDREISECIALNLGLLIIMVALYGIFTQFLGDVMVVTVLALIVNWLGRNVVGLAYLRRRFRACAS
jgi:hypothetical protein